MIGYALCSCVFEKLSFTSYYYSPNHHQLRLASSESSPRTGSLSSFSEDRFADIASSTTTIGSHYTAVAPPSPSTIPHSNARPGVPTSLPPPPPPPIPPMASNGPRKVDAHDEETESDNDNDTQRSPEIHLNRPPPQRPPALPASIPSVPQAAAPPPPVPPADATRFPPPPPPPSKPPVQSPVVTEVEEEPDLFEADRDDPYSLFAPQRKSAKPKVVGHVSYTHIVPPIK